jgi:hypothetical protein
LEQASRPNATTSPQLAPRSFEKSIALVAHGEVPPFRHGSHRDRLVQGFFSGITGKSPVDDRISVSNSIASTHTHTGMLILAPKSYKRAQALVVATLMQRRTS